MAAGFLFPGQGSQGAGFLHALPAHPEVTRTFEEARTVLGADVGALDSVEALASTAHVQLALLISGVATARALLAEHVRPIAVAGMSVGAFGAAVACGALAFEDALAIVRLRGDLMQAAYPEGYGLAAIEGLDEPRVEALLRSLRSPELPISISNVNGPRQIVLAGSDAALCAAMALARQRGASRVRRLEVNVPSHGPLMAPVAERLTIAMAGIAMTAPSVPYIGNRRGRPLYDAGAIREDLATSVAHPVRWWTVLEVMRELGATVFVELPPGHVSTDLVSRLIPDTCAVAVAVRGLRAATLLARR